jgi:hypothetical protein
MKREFALRILAAAGMLLAAGGAAAPTCTVPPLPHRRPVTTNPQPWPLARVRPHPRLYVDAAMLARLRERWNDPRFADIVERYRDKPDPLALALQGLATGDAAACSAAVAPALTEPYVLEGKSAAADADDVAFVFDWCYGVLDAEARARLVAKIEAANAAREAALDKQFKLHEAQLLGFHAYITGVLAVAGEPGVSPRLAKAEAALQNWTEYLNEVQGDGAYRDYAYQDPQFTLPSVLFTTATGTDFVKDNHFIAARPEVLLRLLSPDGRGFAAGPGDQSMGGDGLLAAYGLPSAIAPLIAADMRRDGLAQFLGELVHRKQGWPSTPGVQPLWLVLLYDDDRLRPVTPSVARLPLARLFPDQGIVDTRSSWVVPQAGRPNIDLWFYAGPKTAHSDPDAGHFTLTRGSDQLIVNGANYYGTPSENIRRWGGTSFARNTMVFSPVGSTHPDRDGSQNAKVPVAVSAMHYPVSYEEVWYPGEDQYRAEIVEFHADGEHVAATGELSAAYDPEYVKAYQRTIVRLDRNTFLVRDRFDLDGVDRVRMLLHERSKPEASGYRVVRGTANGGILETEGRRVVIARGASEATVDILTPEPVLIRAVGGPGYEQYIDGANVDPAKTAQAWLFHNVQLSRRLPYTVGQWRTEFETTARAADGEMVALISVGAKGRLPAIGTARREANETVVRVRLGDGDVREVRFPRAFLPVPQVCGRPRLAGGKR